MSALSDTHPDIGRKQIELLRAAGPARRARIACEMTTWSVAASRRAILQAHPGFSERDVDLLWVEIHYGKDLADKLRAYLAKREAT